MQLYDSADEISMRLRSTIVMFKGEPVYVSEVTPHNAQDELETTVYYHSLPYSRNSRAKVAPFTEFQKFGNAQTFNTGYFNIQHRDLDFHSVGYLSRLPSRRTRQGIGNENTTVLLSPEYQRLLGRTSITSLLSYQGVKEMFMNVYEDTGTVTKRLEDAEPHSAYALSKDFALITDQMEQVILLYKGTQVAVCSDLSSVKFKIPKKQIWLKQKMAFYGLNAA